ncbi:5404_t:CDS:2 [Funneliformis mosseae]|uniref:5404_t:CDS:1 n=1 Tax=Funneliformis mosseae TaxID=27381 RepID=A0A9N9CZY9_FUNMO|nr:5404_t:CDS:2 [Funneliformis mosseae]
MADLTHKRNLRIGWNYLRQRWERHGATQVAVKILDNSRNITAEFFKEMMPSLRTRPAIPSHVKNHLNRILGISKNPTTQKYVYNTLKYWHMEFSQKRPTECYSDFKAADDWKKKKLLNNPNIPYTNHHPNAHYTSRPLQLPEVINDFTSNQNTHLENFARGEKSIYRQLFCLMPIQLIIYDIDIY